MRIGSPRSLEGERGVTQSGRTGGMGRGAGGAHGMASSLLHAVVDVFTDSASHPRSAKRDHTCLRQTSLSEGAQAAGALFRERVKKDDRIDDGENMKTTVRGWGRVGFVRVLLSVSCKCAENRLWRCAHDADSKYDNVTRLQEWEVLYVYTAT